MLSPPKQTFRLFAPVPRHSRSCSALPKSIDHLSWEEAVVLIERSESPSYIQEKISLVQRKFQSLRPPSRSSNRPGQISDSQTRYRRARSAFPTLTAPRRPALDNGIDPHLLKVEIAGCLPPNDDPDWYYAGAEIATCLPPDHLDPPPGYCQAFSPSQGTNLFQHSRSVILQTQNDELFLSCDSTPGISPTRITTHRAPVDTPSAFELEHWARMNDR